MHRWDLGLLLGAAVCMVGCLESPALPVPPESLPSTTPALVYDQLRNALRESDRGARRQAVLGLTRDFLLDIEARQVGDQAAADLLTNIASTSGSAVLDNPAIIHRQGSRVLVGLPDGMGLFLYDLQAPPDVPPLELSPWTAGLSTAQVTWLADEAGILYFTIGSDHVTSAHYALAERSQERWRVAWFSDEDPDWWFNVRNATVTVSPDLKTLRIVGEAGYNSPAFDELPGSPRRSFTVEWYRQADTYSLSSAPPPDSDRTSWLWQVAVPSPYATLVEFIERIKIEDTVGAGHLVTDPRVVGAAMGFGLNFPENRFQVVRFDPNSITFRSVRGTFVSGFKPPPAGADRPWLILSLAPIGAAPPTP
jgi:hypothetical protein